MIDHWDLRYLDLAKFVSSWSKDPSTQVGAIIADAQRRVVSLGFNGLPRGIEDTHERLHNRELKYPLIVHGERNAIIFACRSLQGCTLYTWPFMPCSICAGMVIQAGIVRCVAPYSDAERWQDSFRLTEALFAEAGVVLDLYQEEQKKEQV